jgi:tetratricopeptide (TPR) repeat protein
MTDGALRSLARAEALGHLRRFDACESACREALSQAPSHPAALRLLAWALLERGDVTRALQTAREAVAAAPEDLYARRILLRALLRDGEGSEAIVHARACALHPDGTAEDHARAARALAAGPGEEYRALARASIDRALARVPHGSPAPRVAYEALRAALRLEDRTRVTRCVRALLAVAPDQPHERAWVARAVLSLGDPRGALAHADEAIARGPNTALAWKVRSLALARLGLRADAAESLEALARAGRSGP